MVGISLRLALILCMFVFVRAVVGHPEFIETPSNTSVSLGGTALLRCTVLNLTGGANYVFWSRLKPTLKVLFIMAAPATDDISERYEIVVNTRT